MTMYKTKLVAFLAMALVSVASAQQPDTTGAAAGDIGQKQELPLDMLQVFAEVFIRIKSAYVDPVEDETLLENAVRGMLAGLDPHTVYLSEDSYNNLQEGTTGKFGGLGIEIGVQEGLIRVIAPIEDTPAERAGLQSGDLIEKIGDKAVRGITLHEAVELMRGAPGSDVILTVLRKGLPEPLTIKITRDVIKVRSVRSEWLQPGYVLLRITSFQERTAASVHSSIIKLRAEQPIKGVVIDLRNNPGGILSAAVSISDMFLDEGVIVSTDGRIEGSSLTYNAKQEDLISGYPLVVLINEGSASASEIVAAALQDNSRAVLVGEKSYGKGSVQTVLGLNGNSALKITTARYYTPSGRSIDGIGVVPDVIVPAIASEPLSRSLSTPERLATDLQLRQALQILQGLSVVHKKADTEENKKS
ncbi:MAG: S41 family peptidase [Candidatus Porifericomitaceae bacterium WSBS_2022_MAG_OTU9]